MAVFRIFQMRVFFTLAKKILQENKDVRIVSTHASQRQSLKFEASNGWNGTICPPDYVKLQIQKRLKTNRVSFGEERHSIPLLLLKNKST